MSAAKPLVFVFVCADERVYGLSLLSDGRNLPRTPKRWLWLRHDTISFSAHEVRRYAGAKTTVALIRLEIGTYYVSEPEPNVLDLRR
jgi:hypothetical protein